MTQIDLESMLNKALDTAKKAAENESTAPADQDLHSLRSKKWIEAIANSLRELYSLEKEPYRVFSRDYADNRAPFGMNEFLYDILVAKINHLPSASGNKTLEYIERAEWVIESELQENSRAAIIDFSKLIIAKANNKLIVLPDNQRMKDWARHELSNIVRSDSSNYYVVFIQHPRNWEPKPQPVTLHQLPYQP